MSDTTDLQQSYYNTSAEKDQVQSDYNTCCDKIERLRAVKVQLYNSIVDVCDIAEDFKSHFDQYNDSWSGVTYNSASEVCTDTLVSDVYGYYHSLTDVLEQIEYQIQQLETERDEHSSLIQSLGNKLSDLWYNMTHDTTD